MAISMIDEPPISRHTMIGAVAAAAYNAAATCGLRGLNTNENDTSTEPPRGAGNRPPSRTSWFTQSTSSRSRTVSFVMQDSGTSPFSAMTQWISIVPDSAGSSASRRS